VRYAVRIESVSFPGKKCYLYRNQKGFIDRHLHRASLWSSRDSAILAVELYRKAIKKGLVKNTRNLDERIRLAEIVTESQIENDTSIIFEDFNSKNFNV